MTKKYNYFSRKNNRNSKMRRKIYRKSKKSVKSRLFNKFETSAPLHEYID